ncbi:MAG: response regulator [Anaerolineales bacterium]|nr:response regulator [Anaerolineales bacterium]
MTDVSDVDVMDDTGQKPPPIDVIYALVVDDEPNNQDFLVRLLQQAKLEVKGASDAKAALAIAEELQDKLKLVMVDYKLPDQSGIELIRSLRERLPNAKLVMATMFDDRSKMRDAFAAGCSAFLVKPHGFMELFRMVQPAISDPTIFDKLDNLIFDQYGKRTWRGG